MGTLSPSGGFSVFLCDRPTSYVLNAAPPIYVNDTCRWYQTSGPTSVTFNPINAASTTVTGLSGKANDYYQFTYSMSNPVTGCIQNSLVTLTYVDTPSLTVFPLRTLACNNDSAILRFNDTGGRNTFVTQLSGPLSTIGTTIYTDTISRYVNISDMNTSGLYIFRVRRNSGSGQSCTEVSGDVRIIVSRQPGVANAGSSQFLNCNVDTTQLAGNIPSEGTGNWYQNSGPNISTIDDTTNNITTVRNLMGGSYQYRWLINGGQACMPQQDDVNVNVADTLPTSAAGGIDQTICFNSILHLQGNQPDANSLGVWKAIPDSGIVFTDSTKYNSKVTGLDSNQVYAFVWKVYNSCGFSTDTVLISVGSNIAAMPADAGLDRCLPDTTTRFTLQGNTPWPGTGKWRKLSGPADSLLSDTSYNSIVTVSGPGHYQYEWSIGNGICASGLDTVMISISDTVSQAFAGADVDTCSDNLFLQGNEPVYGTGRWSLRIGRINGTILYPDSFNTPVENLSQGTYVFRWAISNGACGNSYDDVKVNIANPTTVPDASIGQIWCNPSTISLSANAITRGKGYWSLHGINPNNPVIYQKDSANTTVGSLMSGIYAFKWNSINTMGICPDLYDLRYDTIFYPANAGSDQHICKTYNIQLTGTIGSKGYWRQVSGATAYLDTTSDNTAIADSMSSAGSPYRFVYEINPAYSCPNATDTIEITVYDSTRTPFAGIDQNLCDMDTFFLSGNDVSPDDGYWSQESGPNTVTIEDNDDNTTRVYNTTGGSYLFKWTSSNLGCVKSDFVLIRNYDSSVASIAGPDSVVCPPYSQMRAINNSSHSANWYQVSGPNQANILSGVDPETSISNLIKGTYVFEWVVNNGICPPSRDSVTIDVPYDQPSDAIAGGDTLLCGADSLTLNANSPTVGSGEWSQISGNTVNFVDDTLFNTKVLNLDTGTSVFEWKISNGNCLSTDTIEIENTIEPSEAIADSDSSYCLYVPLSISAQAPLIGTGSWREISNGGANIIDPDSASTEIAGLGTGTYTFEWTVSKGICTPKHDTISISIDSIPGLSDAGPDIYTCLEMVQMAANQPTNGTGTWSQLSGMNIPSILSPNSDTSTIYGLDSGQYSYEWEVAIGGCVNRDTMRILLNDPQSNDQCLQPTVINNPGGTYYGDLCGAKRFGAEPNTAGYGACNTIFYRFRTVGYNYRKSVTLDFTTMNNCPFGIRVSLFDSAACPGLGVQHDTTIVLGSPGYILFDSLKSNQAYILVIDEYRNPCAKTRCNLIFTMQGNALPVELIEMNVRPINRNTAEVKWTSTGDEQLIAFELMKVEEGNTYFVRRVSAMNNPLNNYSVIDNTIRTYPVEYILYGLYSTGNRKEIGRRVLYQGLEEAISIFPNPSSETFKISISEGNIIRRADIQIFDVSGRQVYSAPSVDMSSGSIEIDATDWASGLYQVVFMANGKVYNMKLEVN